MSRPRRPVLAAVCAALLLAITIAAAWSYRAPYAATLGVGRTSLTLTVCDGRAWVIRNFDIQTGVFVTAGPLYRPFWEDVLRDAPRLWALLPLPLLGLWWFGRAKAPQGSAFPVEPVSRDTAV